MAHMLPESIDLEMLGIRLHTGDVAASTDAWPYLGVHLFGLY